MIDNNAFPWSGLIFLGVSEMHFNRQIFWENKTICKIVNNINNPKNEKEWTLIEDDNKIEDEARITNTFNSFFVRKIATLKDNIDKTRVKEPLEKLKSKMEGRNLTFTLKTVTERCVKKVMNEMRKKKMLERMD